MFSLTFQKEVRVNDVCSSAKGSPLGADLFMPVLDVQEQVNWCFPKGDKQAVTITLKAEGRVLSCEGCELNPDGFQTTVDSLENIRDLS